MTYLGKDQSWNHFLGRHCSCVSFTHLMHFNPPRRYHTSLREFGIITFKSSSHKDVQDKKGTVYILEPNCDRRLCRVVSGLKEPEESMGILLLRRQYVASHSNINDNRPMTCIEINVSRIRVHSRRGFTNASLSRFLVSDGDSLRSRDGVQASGICWSLSSMLCVTERLSLEIAFSEFCSTGHDEKCQGKQDRRKHLARLEPKNESVVVKRY